MNPTESKNTQRMDTLAVRVKGLMKRTFIVSGVEQLLEFDDSDKNLIVKNNSYAWNALINRNENLLAFKASLYRSAKKARKIDGEQEVKAGTIGSDSTLGRVAQSIGSYVAPGNISPSLSPIRSGLFGALTPGGGRRLLNPRKLGNGVSRCPSGFEFGGRFTNSQFSTCGAQLFDIPGPLELIARAVRASNNLNIPNASRAESLSQVIESSPSQARVIQIQRMAQIPRMNLLNMRKLDASILQATSDLTKSPAGEGRMIRRDGVILRPVVPSSVLRKFSDNPDMEDGVMIRAVQRPSDISSDDLALLSGPSMSRISFIAPNGTLLTIERARPLTVGERRKFGRMLNRIVGTSDPYDVGNNIREFAKNSQGAFKYSEIFPNIKRPTDLVKWTGLDGIQRESTRWVYETFIKGELRKAKNKKRTVVTGQ